MNILIIAIVIIILGMIVENIRELHQYLIRDEVQKQILSGLGTLPLCYAYYEDPVILDYTTYYGDYEKLSEGLTYRPQRDNYTFVSREIRGVIVDYIEGRATLEQAESALHTFLGA